MLVGLEGWFWEDSCVHSEHRPPNTQRKEALRSPSSSWSIGALSSHCPQTVGVCLPQGPFPLLLSPTQQGAPSILAQPKPAMTSAPGTDQSCPSKRVTSSRSLTRRGSRAGGEGRSMAGWVGAEFGSPRERVWGELALVKLYGMMEWSEWAGARVKGFPGRKGWRDRFHLCALHLFIEHLLWVGHLAGCQGDKNEHSKITALLKLIVWWEAQTCNHAVTTVSGWDWDGES